MSGSVEASGRSVHNKLRGIGRVFVFTLDQLWKSKSNRIVFGIVFLVFLLAPILGGMFLGEVDIYSQGEDADVLVHVDRMSYEDYVGGKDAKAFSRMNAQNIYSIAVMMLVMFSITFVIKSTVEEKTSKLVELLMVSMTTEAMIFGKILGVITFMLIVTAISAALGSISITVTNVFIDNKFVSNITDQMGITPEQFEVGYEMIAIILISLLLAFLFFAMIAALAGASCTTMEDIEAANLSTLIVVMAGYMLPTFLSLEDTLVASYFLCLCPVFSCFAMPVSYYVGDISIWIVLLSWAIQAGAIFYLYKLTGRVYDSLIVHRGKRLKVMDVLRLSRKSKRGVA